MEIPAALQVPVRMPEHTPREFIFPWQLAGISWVPFHPAHLPGESGSAFSALSHLAAVDSSKISPTQHLSKVFCYPEGTHSQEAMVKSFPSASDWAALLPVPLFLSYTPKHSCDTVLVEWTKASGSTVWLSVCLGQLPCLKKIT